MQAITLEPLTEKTLPLARRIDRADISDSFVDSLETIWETTCYGKEHNLLGKAYLARVFGEPAALALLGEAIPWETDPPEMAEMPFYRLMGFYVDRRFRSKGFGSKILELMISDCYAQFGVRPIMLGCHKENVRAAAFYQRHGFYPVNATDGSDRYYLRYPPKN